MIRLPVQLLLLLFAFSIDLYAIPIYPFQQAEKGLIKLIETNKQTFIITGEHLYSLHKNTIKELARLPYHCNDATVFGNNITLATDSGLVNYSLIDQQFSRFLDSSINYKINRVTIDHLQQLWFCSIFNGAYVVKKDAVVQMATQSPVTYCIAATKDSAVWIGTNVGLYKISALDFSAVRYAEEGIEGYAIPDNIVEDVYADQQSNIWAKLPAAMVFVSPHDPSGEAPSFDFIGDKQNEVLSVSSIGSGRNYLFSTAKGVIYTPEIDTHHQHTEIHGSTKASGYLISDKEMGKPVAFNNSTVKSTVVGKKFTWFITEQGVWRKKTKELLKLLASKESKNHSSE